MIPGQKFYPDKNIMEEKNKQATNSNPADFQIRENVQFAQKSTNTPVLLFVVIIAFLFIGLLVFLWTGGKKSGGIKTPVTTQAVASPTPSPVSAIQVDEEELDALDLGNLDADLQDIQNDVNKL